MRLSFTKCLLGVCLETTRMLMLNFIKSQEDCIHFFGYQYESYISTSEQGFKPPIGGLNPCSEQTARQQA